MRHNWRPSNGLHYAGKIGFAVRFATGLMDSAMPAASFRIGGEYPEFHTVTMWLFVARCNIFC